MSLVLAIATAAETLAHHPGSHAARQGDGRVRLDVSTVVPDTCMAVASVERGTPASVQAPRGAEPVTARLERPAELICATVVTAVRPWRFSPSHPKPRPSTYSSGGLMESAPWAAFRFAERRVGSGTRAASGGTFDAGSPEPDQTLRHPG
jgi:hypothetical protein